jgi:uncharacterized membrane protein HdeD (DUF308 family)
MNVIINGKLIMGAFLFLSGMVIFWQPDVLQYILAAVLTVSGIAAIIGAVRDRIAQRGAHFTRKEEDAG